MIYFPFLGINEETVHYELRFEPQAGVGCIYTKSRCRKGWGVGGSHGYDGLASRGWRPGLVVEGRERDWRST